MTTYRIETAAIANVTLFVEADSEEAALAVALDANSGGPRAVRALVAQCGGNLEAESLALDGAAVEREEP